MSAERVDRALLALTTLTEMERLGAMVAALRVARTPPELPEIEPEVARLREAADALDRRILLIATTLGIPAVRTQQ